MIFNLYLLYHDMGRMSKPTI